MLERSRSLSVLEHSLCTSAWMQDAVLLVDPSVFLSEGKRASAGGMRAQTVKLLQEALLRTGNNEL